MQTFRAAMTSLSVCLVVCVVMTGCRDKKNGSADAKGQPASTAAVNAPSIPSKLEEPSNPELGANAEAKKKENLAGIEKKKEQLRLQEEKKHVENAIQNATVLQAPPLEKGKYHETGDFSKNMKEMAENEFKFREAKTKVFRSNFNQKNIDKSALLKMFHARNAVVSPGKYDFDTGNYSIDLVFWQALYDEKATDSGILPRTDDSCKLRAVIKVDSKTAQRWRDSFDDGSLSLTIWYRLVKVEEASWKQNPRWSVPLLAHGIVFSVDVLKFE